MWVSKTLPCTHCFALIALSGIVSGASLSNNDKQFIIAVAQTDLTEAREGQMAQNQAASPDVKNLGRTLATDCTHSYEELTELAAKEGVAIPKGIDAAKTRSVQQLAHLKGDRFDVLYTKGQVVAQKREIALFKREAEHGRDAGLKAWASRMLPVLEKHLQLAEQSSKTAAPATPSPPF